MNLIKQAAEDYRKNTKYVQGIGTIEQLQKIQDNQYHSIVDHWHSYLSQQGDDLMIVDMFRPLYSDLSDMTRRGHRLQVKKLSYQQSADVLSRARELAKQALAIGRASNRWIPVTERLPEEKDATEINGIKVIETLRWHSFFEAWEQDRVRWDDRWIEESAAYWRTPSAYPEPPKSEQP